MAFAGFNISFHEIPAAKKKSLSDIILSNGGTVLYILGKNTTHVITTSAELTSNSYKLQKAKASNITVVTEKWIDETIKKYEKEQLILNKNNNHNKLVSLSGNNLNDKNNNNKGNIPKGIPSTSFYSGFGLPQAIAPTVTLALPQSGPSSGDFQVALFGLNFDPTANFVVRIQSKQNDIVTATSYEFHSSTSLVCHIPPCVMNEGPMELVASNDGKNFGIGVPFLLSNPICQRNIAYNSDETSRNMTIIRSQLDNVRRAVLNIQRLELELSSQLNALGGPSAMIQYDQQYYEKAIVGGAEMSNNNMNNNINVNNNIIEDSIMKPKRLMDRELRLFISSTFKDLQLERNLLIRKVIPQIKRICAERDIIFSYVDLRWGITEAQSSQSTQLLMCLRELQRSNLFIGILGERYGQSIPAETGAPLSSAERQEKEALLKSFQLASKEFPWVEQFKDRSITEIEMRYVLGASELGTEGMPSWFFLRDPYYFEDIPENERAILASENIESAKRVNSLKEDIASSQYQFYNYRRPANICEIILENIKNHIDQNFPEENQISEFEKEKFRHDVTSHHLTRLYFSNEEYYANLDAHVVSSSEVPFIVYGQSGIGKSSLIANWVQGHKSHHPEDVIIEHYIGASSSSTNHIKTILRIMQEMRRDLHIPQNSPLYEIDFDENKEIEKILTGFPVWIERVMNLPNQRRVILILDGMNKFTSEGASDLIWLPRNFPANLRVILTSTTGQYLCNKIINKRNHPSFDVQPLSFAVRKQLCRKYLSELRGKNLDQAQELIIAETAQTSNPRFLLTLLDDICVTAVHDDLTSRIQRVVQAQKISDLYELILQRIESDYDPQRKGHIKCFLCLVWASRKGLILSSEVVPLLTTHFKGVINEDDFGALYMLIDEFFTNSGGLLNFSNEDIKAAVEKYYLKDVQSKKGYHKELALFFNEVKNYDITSVRILDELPYHLEKADESEKLFELLCDIRVIDQLYSPAYKFDFIQYWRSIESITSHRVVDEYKMVLKNSNFPPSIIRADLVYKVGRFLQEMSKYRGAEEIYLLAKLHYENSSSTLEVAKTCYALGDLHTCQEKWQRAEEYFLEALKAHSKEDPESFDSVQTMERLGTLYTNTGKIVEAKTVLERALAICESRFGSENDLTANVIYALGCIYFIEGKSGLGGIDQEKAENWLRRSLEIKERILGDWHPEVARVLNRLGSIYLELVQYNDAEACFLQALYIREEKLGANHSRCLQSHKLLLSCYEMQEKYSDAIDSALKALDISNLLFGEASISSSNILLRLGDLYWSNNQKVEGRESFEKAIDIRKKVLGEGHSSTIEAINTLKERTVPPPPPPPRGYAPIPEIICKASLLQKVPVVKPPMGGWAAGGPPPPPPPPSPGDLKVNVNSNVPSTYDLAVGIQKINLKKQEKKSDRSDARQQYVNMAGLNKRKIQLKSKK